MEYYISIEEVYKRPVPEWKKKK